MSRAFGDSVFHPFVVSTPDYYTYQLRFANTSGGALILVPADTHMRCGPSTSWLGRSRPGDEAIVMGCDGVWDFLPDDALDEVMRKVAARKGTSTFRHARSANLASVQHCTLNSLNADERPATAVHPSLRARRARQPVSHLCVHG